MSGSENSEQQHVRHFLHKTCNEDVSGISRCSRATKAWFSYVGKIPDDRGFYCFLTVPEFADLWKLEIVDIPDRLGWTGTNLENRELFFFPDASQISTMVCDHSRQMKTRISTVGDVGNGFRSLIILYILLGSSLPVSYICVFSALSNSRQIEYRKNLGQTSGDYPIYQQDLGRSAKSKIPDRLGFSRRMKTRLYGKEMYKKSVLHVQSCFFY